LTTFITPAICFVLAFGSITCVLGKSILFSKVELMELGGLERFKNVLAEDFLLGSWYQFLGKRVLLSKTTVVESVSIKTPLKGFFNRQSRWLKMRMMINIPAFIGDLLANPIAFS